MLNEKEKKDLQLRLNRIMGQVGGIQKMIAEGRYCVDVLQQVAAVKAAVNQVGLVILESHAKSCVVQAIQDGHANEALDEMMEVVRKFNK